jgi:hypothetical protein
VAALVARQAEARAERLVQAEALQAPQVRVAQLPALAV